MEPQPDTAPEPRRRRRRIALVATMVIALLAAPAIVLASHTFSDVPNSSDYHDEITQLAESAITIGCGSGRYCPKNDVNREQMAAFLTRGLGYSAANFGAIDAADALAEYVTEVTLPAGGATGGTVYVEVNANLSVFADATYCPCGVLLTVENLDTGEFAPESVFVVPDTAVEGASAGTGAVNWVFEVPSGEEASFGLVAFVFQQEPVETTGTTGVAGASVWGSLVAQYSPFGSTVDAGSGISVVPDAFQDELQQFRDR